MTKNRIVKWITGLLLAFTGIGAVGAGFGFIADPTGESVGMRIDILPAAIFSDFLIPGIVLMIVIGFGHLTALFLLLKNNCWFAVILAGLLLTIWIVVQIGMIGFLSMLQPIFLAIGLLECLAGFMGSKKTM
ncbi:hypothetical protein [Bacillus sp. 1P06AnD]|uniref:hypothetical protein n=1 Tax=Bacillus sp. 1P06AnD TaxID=3132208 RepID=UPI0039A30011